MKKGDITTDIIVEISTQNYAINLANTSVIMKYKRAYVTTKSVADLHKDYSEQLKFDKFLFNDQLCDIYISMFYADINVMGNGELDRFLRERRMGLRHYLITKFCLSHLKCKSVNNLIVVFTNKKLKT